MPNMAFTGLFHPGLASLLNWLGTTLDREGRGVNDEGVRHGFVR